MGFAERKLRGKRVKISQFCIYHDDLNLAEFNDVRNM